jgi:hypothetical protein
MRSCSCYGASQWLLASPSMRFFQTSSATFSIMVRMWLGMPVQGVSPQSTPMCGVDGCNMSYGGSLLDGSHWDSICIGCTPYRNRRHDIVRDILYHGLRELGVFVKREPKGLYIGTQARPADFLTGPAKPGQCDRAMDVVVTNPRSTAALNAVSDRGALIATQLAERKKLDNHEDMLVKYGRSTAAGDFEKVGLAFESSGAFGRNAKSFWAELRSLSREVEMDDYITAGKPYTSTAFTFHQMIPQKISWAIHFMNAQAVMALASTSQVSRLDLANAMPDDHAD